MYFCALTAVAVPHMRNCESDKDNDSHAGAKPNGTSPDPLNTTAAERGIRAARPQCRTREPSYTQTDLARG